MNKFKLASSFATAALVLGVMAPSVFADTNVNVSGLGWHAKGNVNVNNNSSVDISQHSNTVVQNEVSIGNNTGNNSTSFNTGGDNNTNTGGTTTNVGITNVGGSNVANVSFLTPKAGDTNVNIDSLGAKAHANVNVNNNSSFEAHQKNWCTLVNSVGVSNNTGGNNDNFNTWGGNNINTGMSTTNVGLSNTCGSNVLGNGVS